MASAVLNLAAWLERSDANGPGRRFVIWVQGCPLACPKCFSPETHDPGPRRLVDIEYLAERALAIHGIEGLTYTGGEPMEQARGLALLSERLRPAGLSVVCYTGYTLETLRARRDPWVDRLLASVDLLIDGPYVHERAANLPWRGSDNQRLITLTDRYRALTAMATDAETGPRVAFSVSADGFTATGIWPHGFMDRLHERLRR